MVYHGYVNGISSYYSVDSIKYLDHIGMAAVWWVSLVGHFGRPIWSAIVVGHHGRQEWYVGLVRLNATILSEYKMVIATTAFGHHE